MHQRLDRAHPMAMPPPTQHHNNGAGSSNGDGNGPSKGNRSSPDSSRDIARLAPVLTFFFTSDAFWRYLISAARQPDADPSGQPAASTSGCQSQPGTSFPGPAAAQSQANAGATALLAVDPGAMSTQQVPQQSGATASQPEPTLKAHEVKALLKALQSSGMKRPAQSQGSLQHSLPSWKTILWQ